MNKITPILVRTPARSGSTLMMQMLGGSKKIVFDRTYPFEVRHLCYLTKASEVLTKPFKPKEIKSLPFTWNQSFFTQNEPTFLGPLPTNSTLLNKDVYNMGINKHLVHAFLEQLQNEYPNANFYAEKITSDAIIEKLQEVTPCKIIYGLRDPRDQLASIISFNEKRESNGFGWQEGDSQETFARRFVKGSKAYLKKIIKLEQNPQANMLVIRYENLVTDLETEMTKLSKFLETEITDAFVKKNQKTVLDKHSTSSSGENSISKWKTKLTAETQTIFQDFMGSELEILSYDN